MKRHLKQTPFLRNLIFFTIAFFVCSGCTYYIRSVRFFAGNSRDDTEIARVIIPAPAIPREVDDGERHISSGDRRGLFTILEFVPGQHTLLIDKQTKSTNSLIADAVIAAMEGDTTGEFRFNAEPGTIYIVSMHGMGSMNAPAYRLNGPYPARVEIPDTGRTVYLGVRKGLEKNEDTDHLIYVVEENGKKTLYDPFHTLQVYPGYSENGEHLAFWIRNDRHDYQMVLDGVLQPDHYQRLFTDIFLSPNGKHHFFAAQKDGKKCTVTDDKTTFGEYSKFYGYTVRYSPDSEHLVFVVIMEDGKQYLFLDNKKYGPYRRVDFRSLEFTEDSSSFSYSVEFEPEGGWTKKEIALTTP